MPVTTLTQADQVGSIQIFGRVAAPDFPEWIMRHASKLGLREISASLHADCLDVRATGQHEMLNALALACSLGPQSALVAHVDFKSTRQGIRID